MSLKDLFSGKNGAARAAVKAQGSASRLTQQDRLAMLDDLEESGLGWFWATDAEGNLSYLSPAIAQRIGTDIGDLLDQPLPTVFAPEAGDGRNHSLALKLGARKAFSNVIVRPIANRDGAIINISGRPVTGSDGRFCGYRGTGTDITEAHQREEETARLAKFDSLTGLANRHQMARLLDSTLTAFQAAKRNCAVMMLDLDRFKQVNDTLGHAAGDELLKEVASRLMRVIDGQCTIGRLGGDEFQVVLPDHDDRGKLGDIALKIIAILSQPYSLEEGRTTIGASVGIAIAPHDGVSREDIVRSADLALYSAKNSGRGQFRFYSGDLENEALFRRRLEADLQDALRHGELALDYQPVVGANEKVVALEAQMCWHHSERGYIDPDEFQSIFEGSGQQVEIGRWAIGQACEHAAQWPDSVNVAVNVTAAQFATNDFVETVSEALKRSGLAPNRLELEVKESIFLGDRAVIDKTLTALFKLGVRMTLDEFGTGFSSLEYLRRAPFDAIKIGENFFQESMAREGRDLALIHALVALARALNMTTVATGVESLEILKLLRDSGVAAVQGSIYSHPVAHDEVQAEFESGSWAIQPAGPRTQRARRRTVFRKIQVIHDDYSYDVTLRNLSRTGALIQGLEDVPLDTMFVVDLGGGQLAVASVIRSNRDTQGLMFETPLVDDGAGGLCTRNRVSPYALAAAGAPLSALGTGHYNGMRQAAGEVTTSVPKFGYAASYADHG